MIDGYLKSNVEMDDHAIHLLFSANRWEAAYVIQKTHADDLAADILVDRTKIRSLLASGTTVVCDRYFHSGIVYSAAKNKPSLSLSWARAPDRGLPRPDKVVFLDLEEEQARQRGGWGGELYERAEMQRRVRELFLGLSRGGKSEDGAAVEGMEESWVRNDREDLTVVNAGGSVEEVSEAIWAVVSGVEGRERMVD